MWGPDGNRLPAWVTDAYDVLAPEILAQGEGIVRDDAESVLTDREDLDLTPTEAEYAVD